METAAIGIETDIIWKCRKCGHRQPMDTPDGNEEWKFHCDDAMAMQPRWWFVASDCGEH